jgi:ketosteroid isomerase-like protein
MTHEPTAPDLEETFRRSIAAIGRRDFDGARAAYGPDAVWDGSPTGVGVFQGRDANSQWTHDIAARVPRIARTPSKPWAWEAYAVSQENVQRLLSLNSRLFPDAGADVARIVRDDELWARGVRAAAPYFHDDYELVTTGLPGGTTVAKGSDDIRALNLDWFAPFATYRQEVEEVLDCGDRVLLLVRIFARPVGSVQELSHAAAEVFVFREGKIARVELCGNRARARKAVGLEG